MPDIDLARDGDAQPPEEHDNGVHARDFVDAEEAADAAPVQSVGGRVGNVTVGGALFEETESVELLIQWDNFLNDEESAFEGYMENEDQSDNIVSSGVAMELVFDYDQRDE